MGLVKRVDYNGRVKQLEPDWVVPANNGGPGINNPQNKFKEVRAMIILWSLKCPVNGLPFTEQNYINPGDPNHLHYYIPKWYSQDIWRKR